MFLITEQGSQVWKKISSPLFVLFVFVLLAGCTGISRKAVFPPERPDLMAIADQVDGRTFEVLGVVQVDGRNFTNEKTLIEEVRETARELGADDVLNVRVMSLPRGKGLINGFIRYHLLTAEGIAVRWKTTPVRQAHVLQDDGSEVTQ